MSKNPEASQIEKITVCFISIVKDGKKRNRWKNIAVDFLISELHADNILLCNGTHSLITTRSFCNNGENDTFLY